ncbi:hypothetical protein J4714_13105 [Staphylococcus epidermidis]|nr:hypothetical protein [Staphylococcus epidermidis]
MAVDARGRVWAWGANAAGQLGQGICGRELRPLGSSCRTPVKAVAAGATHCLALDVKGSCGAGAPTTTSSWMQSCRLMS